MKTKVAIRLSVLVALILVCLASLGEAASITVNSPNGGETWTKGTRYTIRWSTSPDLAAEKVIVMLKQSGRPVLNLTGTEGTENDGDFSWTIPADVYEIRAGSGYTIRVKTKRATGRVLDESNASFSIANPPPLVPIPNGVSSAAGTTQGMAEVTRSVVGRQITVPSPTPELVIRKKESTRPGSDPVQIGDRIPFTLAIHNHGETPATVQVASMGPVGAGFVEKLETPITIDPRRTVPITVRVTVKRSLIVGDLFKTSLFLIDPAAPGTGVADLIWKDGNKDDNTLEVSWPVVVPHRVRVTAHASQFFVGYDGDDGVNGAGELNYLKFELGDTLKGRLDEVIMRPGTIGSIVVRGGGRQPYEQRFDINDNEVLSVHFSRSWVEAEVPLGSTLFVGTYASEWDGASLENGSWRYYFDVPSFDRLSGEHCFPLSTFPVSRRYTPENNTGPILRPMNAEVCLTPLH